MPAYLLSFIRAEDVETHGRDYLPHAHVILEKHGGKALSVTDQFDTWEGSLPEGRLVLVEFPSKEDAESFYADPDYQPFKAIRHKISSSDAILFDSGMVQ